MSLVIASIDIDASMQDVWDHVMDPEKLGSWVTIVDRLERVDPGPIRPGFRMSQTLCLRGVHFKVHWTLEEVDAPRFARWEGRGPARSTAVTENRLTEREGRTHFDYRNEFRTPFGVLGAAASKVIVGGIPEKEANASLRRLKDVLEVRV
ncbi:MAG: SRPBCC family protein [Actinobacteria bacterium]|nr:SRPBCC family protein [Actinomycetota bacterium]